MDGGTGTTKKKKGYMGARIGENNKGSCGELQPLCSEGMWNVKTENLHDKVESMDGRTSTVIIKRRVIQEQELVRKKEDVENHDQYALNRCGTLIENQKV